MDQNKSDNSGSKKGVLIGCGTLILILLLCGIFGSLLDDDTDTGTTNSSPTNSVPTEPMSEAEKEEEEERRRRASYTWSTTYFVNEWGERTSGGAKSLSVSADSRMGFPYGDVEAQLFVQCQPQYSWIRFTVSPNLTGGNTESGYDVYNLRVRIDGNSSVWRATQEWGDNDINLPSSARATFARAQTFRIVLPWYGEGSVVFSWDLTGASATISEACN